MALFTLFCECGESKRVIADSPEKATKKCSCGKDMTWQPQGMCGKVVETYDTGAMAKVQHLSKDHFKDLDDHKNRK